MDHKVYLPPPPPHGGMPQGKAPIAFPGPHMSINGQPQMSSAHIPMLQGPFPIASEGQPVYQAAPVNHNPVTYEVNSNSVDFSSNDIQPSAGGGGSYGTTRVTLLSREHVFHRQVGPVGGNPLAPPESWPAVGDEMPKIAHMDVKCEKNLMKVAIEFDRPFNGNFSSFLLIDE